uniref:Uncharacterized protein n=1 Tax=Roseihalotalea indica TaxID=2867963 RepID=A0AA49GJL1_9BACT|nr:hypothetical protein K4G66_27085 [Tunicatimonas sp. TK19036]
MRRILIIGFGFLLLTSFIYTDFSGEFKKLLYRTNMSLKEPKGLTITNPIKNEQMNWELAYKHPEKRFEVRYAIRPMDTHLKDYQMSKANEGSISIHPNKWYKSSFEATLLNISGGQLPYYSAFDPEAVKNEFNADWGAVTMVNVDEEFGQDYDYCFLVFIHRDNFGDAYIFYLADDKETLNEEIEPIFHNLKFNE